MSTQAKESTLNGLQVKALLLDTITHYKHGMHLAPNYMSFKRVFLRAVGLTANADDLRVLEAIGNLYIYNGMRTEFTSTLIKFKVDVNLILTIKGQEN